MHMIQEIMLNTTIRISDNILLQVKTPLDGGRSGMENLPYPESLAKLSWIVSYAQQHKMVKHSHHKLPDQLDNFPGLTLDLLAPRQRRFIDGKPSCHANIICNAQKILMQPKSD